MGCCNSEFHALCDRHDDACMNTYVYMHTLWGWGQGGHVTPTFLIGGGGAMVCFNPTFLFST